MGICVDELRHWVVRPALKELGDWNQATENLLLGTAAMESGLGFHLQQTRKGYGVFQISAKRHNKLWDSYIGLEPELASYVRGCASQRAFLRHPHSELATNLNYATLIAWMVYRRHQPKMPKYHDDIEALAKLWARYYRKGKSSQTSIFIENYDKYVAQALVSAA